MEAMKKNRSIVVVALCLVIILISGFVSAGVMSNNGEIVIKEVTISPYGGDLAASMYIPKLALKTDEAGNFINTVPAVIVNAGFTNSRTYLDNVAIELARCGFAVIQIDMYGHGHSEIINNRGFSVPPSPFDDDVSLCGAQDALDYLRTLGFVDQTRIGMCGHSLGGAGTGRMAQRLAGFYTLQDELLNVLHSEFGISVTEEQVAAQDADTVAAALNEKDSALYELRKEQITSEYNLAVRNYMIYDAGPTGCDPHEVEVAGISVWRDLQANLGMVRNLSGNGGAGMQNTNAPLVSDETKMILSLDGPAEKDTWYQTNLSNTTERAVSTKIAPLYSDASDLSVQAAAESNSLRTIVTPFGWHGFTYLSTETAKASVQFFSTGFAYNNGNIVAGDSTNTIINPDASHWMVKDIASAIGFIALLILILPLVELLMKVPFFASLRGEPKAPVQSKKSPVFWIFAAIFVLLPVLTYSMGTGWGSFIQAGPLSTVQLPTQVAFWAIIMAAILLVLMVIKYMVYDKKQFGLSFRDMYGLKYGGKNVGKSILLALAVFGLVSVLLTVYYNLFGAANLKITPGGAIVFTALSKVQYYNWALYAIYFLPFYLLNSMLVNSARFKDMSEKASTWLMAVVNAIGMFILACIQFLLGYVLTGKTVFPTPPGSSALVYMISFFFVMLFVSAIINRKLYQKTGSSIPGALLNVALFTIPAIQVFMYYSM